MKIHNVGWKNFFVIKKTISYFQTVPKECLAGVSFEMCVEGLCIPNGDDCSCS